MQQRQILLGFFLLLTQLISAQTASLGTLNFEETLRRQQLLGQFDSTLSFCLRPIHLNGLKESTILDNYYPKLTEFRNGYVSFLPVETRFEFNSHHPYGWNNGSLLRSRGLQFLQTGGLFLKYRFLSIQFAPEFVFVQNKSFAGLPHNYPQGLWRRMHTEFWNEMDTPEQFGPDPLYFFTPGQSSVRLNFGPISFGVATENIWWGPGRMHSLIMTNNARGFPHLTLNSIRPLKTGIGSFEWQFIAGKLTSSGFKAPRPPQYDETDLGIVQKPNDSRYLNAMSIIYSPNWIPGFSIGVTRSLQVYFDSVKVHKDYFPLTSKLLRVNDISTDSEVGRDGLFSINLRWLWTRANAEIYAEYGRTDAAWNLRDILLAPEHSGAFVLGFTKVVELSAKDRYVEVIFECAHLSKSGTRIFRPEPSWYTNSQVRHGHTNQGEILGSGIGSGSNAQMLGLNWFSKLNSFGIQLERKANNQDWFEGLKTLRDDAVWNDFMFGTNYPLENWIDVSLAINGSQQLGNWIFTGNLQGVRSLNYQWKPIRLTESGATMRSDKFNLYAFLKIGFIIPLNDN